MTINNNPSLVEVVSSFKLKEKLSTKIKLFLRDNRDSVFGTTDNVVCPYKTDYSYFVSDGERVIKQKMFKQRDEQQVTEIFIDLIDWMGLDIADHSPSYSQLCKWFNHGYKIDDKTFIPAICIILNKLVDHLVSAKTAECLSASVSISRYSKEILNTLNRSGFEFQPVFFNQRDNQRYQKLIRSFDIGNKTKLKAMVDYLSTLTSILASAEPNNPVLESVYSFYKPISRILAELSATSLKASMVDQVIVYKVINEVTGEIDQELRFPQKVDRCFKYLVYSQVIKGENKDIENFKNRIFGKGLKLFVDYKFADPGNSTEDPGYDIENFTKDFNEMIKQRLEKKQAFIN